MSGSRYRDWLRQASEDLNWGRDSFEGGYYPQACFIAQQAAEKALKALVFFRGYDAVKSHSIVKIAQALEINDEILKAGKRLDQYYIATRYPDAMPEGIASEFITQEQAGEALTLSGLIYDRISALLEEKR